ncbi:MAG TPA: hypothetical protein VMO26_27855 [Vicinamibacterales bacterium]|nr:hypothetical protein [Vicinamibacterales bacterium]
MRRAVAALLALSLIGIAGLDARDEQLPGWFDLPVPGGVPTLEALEMTLDERAFTLTVLARGLHDRDQRIGLTPARLAKVLEDLTADTSSSHEATSIPAPLEASIWRDLLPPPRPPAPDDLFLRIITDRNALLLASGLTATHSSVRALVTRDRELLRFLYREAAGPFVLTARRLQVGDDGVVVPGGPRGAEIWQSLTGVSPARPGEFLRALLTKDHGRLAWYYDTIGGIDGGRLAAVWPDTNVQLEHAATLYAAFRDSDLQWRVTDQPFRRGINDAWMVVTQLDVRDRFVASPLPERAWDLLFSNSRVNADQISRALAEPPSAVSMPWLAREILRPLVRERRFRFESVRLAQRVFSTAAPETLPDIVVALNGLRHHRALMFALERMAIDGADTWAAAVLAARHVSNNAVDARYAVPAFQAAVALIERIRHARTIEAAAATRLVRSLSDTVRADRRVSRAVSNWVIESLMPALPPLAVPDAWTGRTAYESTILQALAGPIERTTSPLEWEGLSYTVDVVAAEHERLRRVRQLLPSPGLDAALASDRARDLTDALTALVYATALGDPEGPASLSPDVVTRHDLGLSGTSVVRDELPWAPPEERQGFGPWRVNGSLIGLDLGLSRLVLRRVADQQMPAAPTFTLNDLGTLTRTTVAMVPGDLDDRDRDELAAAMARGRARVMAARTADELEVLARECRMSDTTRQLLPWIVSRQREAVPSLFALRDLLWLGRPRLEAAELDRWGVAADGIDGRRVLAMPRPAPWEDYGGRSEAGQVATQVPDLTLRLVEESAALRLPASLVPALLAFALEDYWHDVRARFADDWPRLTRQAASLPSSRIDDYVAALTGDGPLRTQ